LLHLPESTQRFLRRTAVLDQLSAPLCDALLDDNNSQGELRALEASNVFLVALDRRREWYRYHALFRDFLLGLLRQTEPDLIMELHVRAAHWYESNGSPASALEHLLDTGERERCVRLVTELSMPTYQAGQISTVMRWLRALGDPAIESYPPLGVIAGWAAALSGSSAEAQKWAHFIDTAEWDAVPADGSASFASARSMLRAIMCASGPEQAITDGDFAVAAEPPWSPWRGTALAVAGEAHLLAGDVDKAAALFGESSAVAAVDLNADNLVVSESELGLLAMDRGRWSEAADHVDLALATIDARRMHDYGVCLLAFAAAARLSVHRGDISEATRRLTQAMRARPSCTYAIPGLAVRLRLQLAQVYLALADRTTARHLVREIDDILLQRPALGALVEQVAHFRQVLAASAHLGATGGSPLSPAELRLLPYLQTHLTIGEIAGQLYVSRNTASSEVSSIYRKLGVSSRKDAVEQATMLGLLGV
jgi:LuxR family maltose regulon positive regulatory protein